MNVTDSIRNFLLNATQGRNGGHAMLLSQRAGDVAEHELQVNVAQGEGELVANTKSTYSDGIDSWWNIRVPKGANDANGGAHFKDYELKWPLHIHAEAIGFTGWNWVKKQSEFVGFDFDAIAGHAKGVGISDNDLTAIKDRVSAIPWVEVRKSTRGRGLHLYVQFAKPPVTANHTEHKALARCVLGLLSEAAGFDFASQVDACGAILWVWHRDQSEDGFDTIKPATEALADVPANWRDHVLVVKRKRSKVAIANTGEGAEGAEGGSADDVERLASAQTTVALDDVHRQTMDTIIAEGFPANWIQDHGLLQTHTKGLEAAHKKLKLKGLFQTSSEGKDPNTCNCFAFPIENGAWRVYRFSQGVAEAPTWNQDGQGWTTCRFNVAPSLREAAIGMGAGESSSGEFHFESAADAIAAVQLLGQTLALPAEFALRAAKVKPSDDDRHFVSIKQDKKNEPSPGKGWVPKRGGWWERGFSASVDSLLEGYPLTEVVLGHDIDRIVKEAIAVLQFLPDVVQRGGRLYRIRKGSPATANDRPAHCSGLHLESLGRAELLTLLSLVVKFVRKKGSRRVSPDQSILDAILAYGDYPGIRTLKGMVQAPFMWLDGEIVDKPGYHAPSGRYLDFNLSYPPVGENHADAVRAKDLLVGLVKNFPFPLPVYVSAWLAALLSAVGRLAFAGACPMFAGTANAPGTGKGMCADLIGIIVCGCCIPRMIMPNNDDELRKRISAFLDAALSILMLFDEIETTLNSPTLKALITSDTWSDRVLGQHRMMNAEVSLVVLATGNNLQFSRDMARRCVPICLETSLERPEMRTDFEQPRLLEWCREHRGELLSAALTILRAYHVAGRPNQNLPSFGSFEPWSDLIRSAIVWVGLPDPVSAQLTVADQDVDAALLHQLIKGWHELDPEAKGVTVAEAIELMDRNPARFEILRATANELEGDRKRALGYALRRFKGRICGGKKLDVKMRRNVRTWVVSESEPAISAA